MSFFGENVEVTPPTRLVRTNVAGDGETGLTTVTFKESGGATLVVLRDLHPSKKALDDAVASGSTSGRSEQVAQLDELLAAPSADVGLERE